MALSNFSQTIGLTVQNFSSAAVGIAVLFALIRGIQRTEAKAIGNFWRDLTRIFLYILIPLSLFMSIMLMAGGVPQTTGGYKTATLVQPVAVDKHNSAIYGAEINVKKIQLGLKIIKLMGQKL